MCRWPGASKTALPITCLGADPHDHAQLAVGRASGALEVSRVGGGYPVVQRWQAAPKPCGVAFLQPCVTSLPDCLPLASP